MKNIVVDQDGNCIDELAKRNDEIKVELEPILQEFIKERNSNRVLKVKEKLGFRFAKQIFYTLSKFPRMSAETFMELAYEDIEDYWLKYQELTSYYNRHFEIVDNKQLLMAFMGINNRQYCELENHEDENIVSLMNSINSTFVGLGFVAGESGNADVKATSQRMRTKGEGHNLISASEDKLIETVEKKSPLDLEIQLASIMGGNPKMLNK